MEHTDWLDVGLSSADARFLMLTAITHHTFSSPAWEEHEVCKLDETGCSVPVAARFARTAPLQLPAPASSAGT
jgi:hypothetical protein